MLDYIREILTYVDRSTQVGERASRQVGSASARPHPHMFDTHGMSVSTCGENLTKVLHRRKKQP